MKKITNLQLAARNLCKSPEAVESLIEVAIYSELINISPEGNAYWNINGIFLDKDVTEEID